jgi:hypothetical protein
MEIVSQFQKDFFGYQFRKLLFTWRGYTDMVAEIVSQLRQVFFTEK